MAWSRWYRLHKGKERSDSEKIPIPLDIPNESGVYELALTRGGRGVKRVVYFGITYRDLRRRLNDHAGIVAGSPFHPELYSAVNHGYTLWGRYRVAAANRVKAIETRTLKGRWWRYPLNRQEMPWRGARRRNGSCRYHQQKNGTCV